MADETLTHGSLISISADEAVVLETTYARQPQLGDTISLEVLNRGSHIATIISRMWSDEGKTLQLSALVI
jgi:hypothetical protein